MFSDFDKSDEYEAGVIAGVLLAGWTITELAMPIGSTAARYWLQSPNGGTCGYHNTKYTAALAAQTFMHEGSETGWCQGDDGKWDTRRSA